MVIIADTSAASPQKQLEYTLSTNGIISRYDLSMVNELPILSTSIAGDNVQTFVDRWVLAIQEVLQDKASQPVLFAGSGLSRRYFDAPTWSGLLTQLAQLCPYVDQDLAYYQQTYGSLQAVAQAFVPLFQNWAWGDGRDEFPDEYFSAGYSQDVFLKHKVAEILKRVSPNHLDQITDARHSRELWALQSIRPHAVITTNYDPFLELVFPEYETVVGDQVIQGQSGLYGELYKIHGSVSDPTSLVITTEDYRRFDGRTKYLSAKLLPLSVEHPLLIVGYSIEDPNIRRLLSDIDLIIEGAGALNRNIFLLRRPKANETPFGGPFDELIQVSDTRTVRVQSIVTSEFDWVFNAFATANAMERINPKLLRSLLARTFDIVAYGVPRGTIEVDYQSLESAIEADTLVPRLIGISQVSSNPNETHPFTLTGVGHELGYSSFNQPLRLVNEIKEQTGVDIKASDNRYHLNIKTGDASSTHKYSPEFIELLRTYRDDPETPIELRLQ